MAVYFNLGKRRVVLACDKWDRVESNVWAIAKHVEAMRGQDRWGVGSVEQAFTGYLALPEPSGRDCLSKLGIPTADGLTEEIVMTAWRAKVRVVHPAAGGSEDALREVNEAKDIALTMVRKGAA